MMTEQGSKGTVTAQWTNMRYNAGILNNAPQSVGQVPANLVDPTMAGISGAIGGFGLGGRFQNMFRDIRPAVTPQPFYNTNATMTPI